MIPMGMGEPVERLFCPDCGACFRQNMRRCPIDGEKLAMLGEDPQLGRVLGKRYLVQSLIAEGGMGRVYFATDATSGEGRYAIKVLYGELAADPVHYERFVREAARASGFDHPNLVRVLDFGSTVGKQPYVVMEHIAGRSLGAVIKDEAPLPTERVVRLVSHICRALAYVHPFGVVHRDVKGGNVLVSGSGDDELARLFDFGVALEVGEARLTQRQTAIGTLTYMSPERALCQPFDHRADLFSVGVVLYQLLSGERPFSGTPMMVAIQNLTLSPPSIAERTPDVKVDPRLEAMAIKLMAKDPARRYQSADEVLAELAGI
jgi:serine/threonine-protein kinase